MALVKQTAHVNVNSYASHQMNAGSSNGIPDDLSVNKPLPTNKSEPGRNHSQSDDKEKDQLTQEDIGQLTDHLNKFMEAINADLKFEMHEGTERIIVKFVNKKDNQVIREFPPHELLDTLAAIRNYVGILLDKRV